MSMNKEQRLALMQAIGKEKKALRILETKKQDIERKMIKHQDKIRDLESGGNADE